MSTKDAINEIVDAMSDADAMNLLAQSTSVDPTNSPRQQTANRYKPPMTVKDEIRRLVDEMADSEAQRYLDFLNMMADPDELTDEDIQDFREADADYVRGDYVSLDEPAKELGVGLHA